MSEAQKHAHEYVGMAPSTRHHLGNQESVGGGNWADI